MKIEICNASHAPDLAGLFVEMEEHYYGKNVVSKAQMLDYLTNRMFSTYSGAIVICALEGRDRLGFACITIMHPSAHCGGQVFMKELYVAARYRGRKVGEALVKFIAAFAVEQGCNQFAWLAEKSNTRAIKFYQAMGANVQDGMHYFSVGGDSLRHLATRED